MRNDLLSALGRLRDISGNRVVLRSHKAASTSNEILRSLEGALGRLEPDSVLLALTCPKEIKTTIKLTRGC